MPLHRNIISILLILSLASCDDPIDNNNGTGGENPSEEVNGNTDPNHPNILLIIADDLGKDAIAGYDEGVVQPFTPTLDSIRQAGLTFDNCWVYPTCSPTRASILTGRYGLRTGVQEVGDDLSADEIVLHRYLNINNATNYATALVGKWHLSRVNNGIQPEEFGIDYFAGILGGGVGNYYNWGLTEDGVTTNETRYTTEVLTDLASDWIGDQTDPWFLWLAYNAPHTPFHSPPDQLHHQDNLPPYTEGGDDLPYYLASIEAMDTEIGRLLRDMPAAVLANTYIIFIGDNGTPGSISQSPYSRTRSKGSLYQGGINTPLFISGPGVTRQGEREAGLLSGTDLYATISQLAGDPISVTQDSRSFMSLLSMDQPIREYHYAQNQSNTGVDNYAISNGQFKLHQYDNHQEFYRLTNDPYEDNDLLLGELNNNQVQNKEALETAAMEIRE